METERTIHIIAKRISEKKSLFVEKMNKTDKPIAE
jgi:hypothetical protein